uniref:Uncharacterized protein n=1 Tax=Capra hircus TaxID=9925 RepID=A0A8C2P0I3_CAPHI
MSEAYFRVESGALGPQENFLSLDDILMSHEKLSVRTEIPMPRLGAFFLDRSGGAETDNHGRSEWARDLGHGFFLFKKFCNMIICGFLTSYQESL